jgi:hypothetical protein
MLAVSVASASNATHRPSLLTVDRYDGFWLGGTETVWMIGGSWSAADAPRVMVTTARPAASKAAVVMKAVGTRGIRLTPSSKPVVVGERQSVACGLRGSASCPTAQPA